MLEETIDREKENVNKNGGIKNKGKSVERHPTNKEHTNKSDKKEKITARKKEKIDRQNKFTSTTWSHDHEGVPVDEATACLILLGESTESPRLLDHLCHRVNSTTESFPPSDDFRHGVISAIWPSRTIGAPPRWTIRAPPSWTVQPSAGETSYPHTRRSHLQVRRSGLRVRRGHPQATRCDPLVRRRRLQVDARLRVKRSHLQFWTMEPVENSSKEGSEKIGSFYTIKHGILLKNFNYYINYTSRSLENVTLPMTNIQDVDEIELKLHRYQHLAL
uniref:Uncharacterized protein n=1 Tax=Romanomermis culicivorax TaxID=13658 RepID=A0A915HV77_ROMCU